MPDTRCRWCADWLLPIANGGDGWPYCCDECETASLTRTLDLPSRTEPWTTDFTLEHQ